MSKHRHVWTSLWSHFGPYGEQDAHFHSCQLLSCNKLLVAKGRDTCTGKVEGHKIK